MATFNDWLEGARLRTLPAAVAPVFAGTGLAYWVGHGSLVRALLAGFVALAFQVGANFANDYSDGIRGTDDIRTGPPRLTGGAKTAPRNVKIAAFSCFAAACLAGLALIALAGTWWLLLAGLAAVCAAWFYTGGTHPYGYIGLGEVFVFLFFGLLATAGTIYTQALQVPWQGWYAACALGLIACALLMCNNIRDIPTDVQAGKRTLAVRLGDARARLAYQLLALAPLLASVCYLPDLGWRLVFLLPACALAVPCVLRIRHARGRALIPVLRDTGFLELAYGLGLCAAFLLA
ncbi:MAG: 1,4-dihydroxy-2-naphthoate polyprenyltransferase [Actinomycetaceae bacterium]|nr:1,4-dihydroxy-2-naphthoate polyprenyltransferase [Actinomycetaceae bacterium]